jgi:hypothetical protein
MTKQRDLFDQCPDLPGQRQVDIEDLIQESTFEESLAGRIMAGDRDGANKLQERAKAGEIIRIM